jgi:hypothetical protein
MLFVRKFLTINVVSEKDFDLKQKNGLDWVGSQEVIIFE